ncbi:MAG: lactate utilization protein [Chloroflexota bacterium]|nr:lactate utilization protein [Chloroflexota bacterium]
MTSARETILNKLRSARRPFDDATPRPQAYIPVIPVENTEPDSLIARFIQEMDLLKGKAFAVKGDDEASALILDLLRQHNVDHVLAWEYRHIPVAGLEDVLRSAGIRVTQPRVHEERSPELMAHLGSAGAGVSGVDTAVAMTGTLILSSGEGKGRIPTVLPPVWIAVVALEQLVPRLEDWLASERAHGMTTVHERANLAFVTGPSRTGDIEMQLILGVHGPGTEYVIIKQ